MDLVTPGRKKPGGTRGGGEAAQELRTYAPRGDRPEGESGHEGWIDSIDLDEGDLTVRGWAHDFEAESCRVSLYVRGVLLQTRNADEPRKVRAEHVRYGYTFFVTDLDPAVTLDDVEVRNARSGHPLKRSSKIPVTELAPVMPPLKPGAGGRKALPGKLEVFSAQKIEGWASRTPDDPHPFVEVLVNGVLYALLPAKVAREDVTRAGYDGVGFQTRLILSSAADGADVAEARLRGVSLGQIACDALPPRNPAPRTALSRKLAKLGGAPVAIVVPVYNAAAELAECLAALMRHTTFAGAELILIDDASPDPQVEAVLAPYRAIDGVRIVRNDVNLGFAGTANRGVGLAEGRDVVLLNADTRVTPRWLENLRLAAYSDADIASATAMSDNAGVFSLPLEGAGEALDDAAQARLVTQASGQMHFTVPTNHGFCVYLRRDALDAVGAFDAEAFPQGYGEENDWSMRAAYGGWRHVVDDRTLVFHRRGASFKDRRSQLRRQGIATVERRYPEYKALVGDLALSPEMLTAKHRVRLAIEQRLPRATGRGCACSM